MYDLVKLRASMCDGVGAWLGLERDTREDRDFTGSPYPVYVYEMETLDRVFHLFLYTVQFFWAFWLHKCGAVQIIM